MQSFTQRKNVCSAQTPVTSDEILQYVAPDYFATYPIVGLASQVNTARLHQVAPVRTLIIEGVKAKAETVRERNAPIAHYSFSSAGDGSLNVAAETSLAPDGLAA
jgi:hypothetical protein